MGALSQKIPIFLVEPCREIGIFGLKAPISGTLLTPKPSFPGFGDFDPCRGRTLSQIWTVLREPKFRTEFPYFSREKWPEFRRKRDLYEPLSTAMAPVLASLKRHRKPRKALAAHFRRGSLCSLGQGAHSSQF